MQEVSDSLKLMQSAADAERNDEIRTNGELVTNVNEEIAEGCDDDTDDDDNRCVDAADAIAAAFVAFGVRPIEHLMLEVIDMVSMMLVCGGDETNVSRFVNSTFFFLFPCRRQQTLASIYQVQITLAPQASSPSAAAAASSSPPPPPSHHHHHHHRHHHHIIISSSSIYVGIIIMVRFFA
jgi:hypothetical protein